MYQYHTQGHLVGDHLPGTLRLSLTRICLPWDFETVFSTRIYSSRPPAAVRWSAHASWVLGHWSPLGLESLQCRPVPQPGHCLGEKTPESCSGTSSGAWPPPLLDAHG
jgi:hypothetical protein